METMLYTIDHINSARDTILPRGISLGAHVLDDCDTDTYGLEQAVEFIKGRREMERKSLILNCHYKQIEVHIILILCLLNQSRVSRTTARYYSVCHRTTKP